MPSLIIRVSVKQVRVLRIIAGPILSINFDSEAFSGPGPSNNITRFLDDTYAYHLTGLYENASAHATRAVFELPSGGFVSQGTLTDMYNDTNCNHEGYITGGRVMFREASTYKLLFRVEIASTSHMTELTLTLEGGCPTG